MTKSKNTKRALWASVLSMLVCVALLVGSTFAWFSDSVTSGKNKIVAGNLDVELEYSTDGETWNAVGTDTNLFKPADETLWEPGHTEYVYLRVSNVGSLALKYQFAVNVYGDEDGAAEKEYTSVLTDETGNNEKFKLSNYLVFSQTEGTATVASREDLWIQDTAAEKAAMGKLDGLGKAAVLLPDASETMTLAVYMPTQVGNEANQLTSAKTTEGEPTIFLGLTLNATQTPHEEDSFDNQYDANADGSPDYNFGVITATEVTAPVVDGKDTVLTNGDGTAVVTVPSDAVADDVDKLTLTITPRDTVGDASITITEGETDFAAYDVEVTTLKENNTTPITVKMFVGKGRTVGGESGVKVYHHGTEITGASYDSETGYVTYTSTSFSPFTIVFDDPEARIGDYYYYKLIDALQQDGTITMLKDVTANVGTDFSNSYTSKANGVLNMEGHTLTLDNQFVLTGTLEINNGSILPAEKFCGYTGRGLITVKAPGCKLNDVTLNDEFSSKAVSDAIYICDAAETGKENANSIELNRCTVYGSIELGESNSSNKTKYSKVTINEGTKMLRVKIKDRTAYNPSGEQSYQLRNAFYAYNCSIVEINGGLIESRMNTINHVGAINTMTTTITGGTVNVFPQDDAAYDHYVEFSTSGYYTPQDYTGSNQILSPVNDPDADYVKSVGNVTITGGTFNKPLAMYADYNQSPTALVVMDSNDYVAAGYEWRDNSNGTYSVVKSAS